MTSKEMKARSGVPRANIRYYEAEGLLTPQRAKNGCRDYSEADLAVWRRSSCCGWEGSFLTLPQNTMVPLASAFLWAQEAALTLPLP